MFLFLTLPLINSILDIHLLKIVIKLNKINSVAEVR